MCGGWALVPMFCVTRFGLLYCIHYVFFMDKDKYYLPKGSPDPFPKFSISSVVTKWFEIGDRARWSMGIPT